MKSLIKIFLIVCLINGNNFYLSQELEKKLSKDESEIYSVFKEIESAFSMSDVSAISNFFLSQNYLSLSTGASGYYSSNQAFYVLQDFLNIYRPISFKFTNIKIGNSPYATGVLFYESKSKRGSSQVYVSIQLVGDGWKISHLTIK